MDWQKILSHALAAGATGLIAWFALGGRRALKNFGKTELEIAVDSVEEAVEALKRAKATPDKTDDVLAEQKLKDAKAKLNQIKRLKGILDAFGDTEVPK